MTELRASVVPVVYVVLMATLIVAVDLLFFRDRAWERLLMNIATVSVFGAFYWRFFWHRWSH